MGSEITIKKKRIAEELGQEYTWNNYVQKRGKARNESRISTLSTIDTTHPAPGFEIRTGRRNS